MSSLLDEKCARLGCWHKTSTRGVFCSCHLVSPCSEFTEQEKAAYNRLVMETVKLDIHPLDWSPTRRGA